ncbi:hypothetical protein ACOCG7_05910 [Paraburkholderia sp. DD10]|uniref:hypothetical protein n=1 Tax=Paraburkholderia sp. DD10 TaxID=3409691 RepID=UPI003BA26CBE
MISQDTYRKIRTSMIVISLTFGTGVFWAAVAAGIVRYIVHSDEDRTLLFVGGPVFVLYCIWCVARLPDMLRKAGYIE